MLLCIINKILMWTKNKGEMSFRLRSQLYQNTKDFHVPQSPWCSDTAGCVIGNFPSPATNAFSLSLPPRLPSFSFSLLPSFTSPYLFPPLISLTSVPVPSSSPPFLFPSPFSVQYRKLPLGCGRSPGHQRIFDLLTSENTSWCWLFICLKHTTAKTNTDMSRGM